MTTPLALLYHEGHTREHEPLLYTSVSSYDLRVGVGSWDQRAPAVGSMLRHAGLDAYLLQGIGAEQMHVLKPYLDEKYHVVHYLHPNTGTADGVAVALRRERLEPISSRSVVMWASKKFQQRRWPADRAAGAIVCAVERMSGLRIAFGSADLTGETIEPERRILQELRAQLRDSGSACPESAMDLVDACVYGGAGGRVARRNVLDAPTGYVPPPLATAAQARSRVGTAASASRLYFSEECVVKRTTLTERFVDVCSKPLPGTAHRVCAAEEGRASGVGGEAAAMKISDIAVMAKENHFLGR